MIWLGHWPADVPVACQIVPYGQRRIWARVPHRPADRYCRSNRIYGGGEDAVAGRGAVFAAAFRGALTAAAQGLSATLITALQVSRVCFVSERELLHRVSGPRIQLTGPILLQKMPAEIDLPSSGYSIRCNISFCTSDVPS